MRTAVSLVVLFSMVALTNPAGAKTFSKSHQATVNRLFKAMELPQVMNRAINQQLQVFSRSNPAIRRFQGVLRRFLRKYLSWKSLRDQVAQIYLAAFSQQEMQELIRFYQTPVGKKSVRLMPKLAAQGAAIGLRRVQQNLPELQRMIQNAKKKTRRGK
ncbi:MAG: hypothetical protein CSA65_07600 [Proteobacteria bacterium]|nr:MAG: hypothetical protein CSB49_01615 [Pseudomonadota bacterium]PIE17757.1 MAG: hypothetical protein CSA65_07600 [Pseudomonadota bacterium]